MSEIPSAEKELQDEISRKIKHTRRFATMDFSLAHLFLWISILASFTSTIIVAYGVPEDWEIVIAIIAGVPGLVILIDKTFDFKRRAVWGAMLRIELQELRDDLLIRKLDPDKASKKFREIERTYESAFSEIGFFSQKKQKDDED